MDYYCVPLGLYTKSQAGVWTLITEVGDFSLFLKSSRCTALTPAFVLQFGQVVEVWENSA